MEITSAVGAVLGAFGLSGAAGLNAWLPLLLVGARTASAGSTWVAPTAGCPRPPPCSSSPSCSSSTSSETKSPYWIRSCTPSEPWLPPPRGQSCSRPKPASTPTSPGGHRCPRCPHRRQRPHRPHRSPPFHHRNHSGRRQPPRLLRRRRHLPCPHHPRPGRPGPRLHSRRNPSDRPDLAGNPRHPLDAPQTLPPITQRHHSRPDLNVTGPMANSRP